MLDPSSRRFPGLALALLLALGLGAAPAAHAADDLDALNEELRVSVARVQYVLDKVRGLDYPLGVQDRIRKKDLVREGKSLMTSAATVAWTDEDGILRLVDSLADLRARAEAFVETVAPTWEKPRRQERATDRSPFQEVLELHDVVEDLEARYDRLTWSERAHAKEMIQQGEDIVAAIKAVRESDHVTRQDLVRKLIGVREELAALAGDARTRRTSGYAFVPTHRTRAPWTQVDHRENGFTAVRVRFLPPQSAYVTVQNDSEESRPLFLELEFHDAAGAPTGSGLYETAPLEELRAGEIREVLVPIFPTHPRFWEETRTFTAYLD
jgi:hypothetical protein